MRTLLCCALVVSAAAAAQDRPDEGSMFGADEPALAADAGTAGDTAAATTGPTSGPTTATPADRDAQQLGAGPAKSRFDTDEEKSDPLKIGGSLLSTGQVFVLGNPKFKDVTLSAPSVLDAYLDARPTDRVRAFALARLQYDPTRSATPSTTSVSTIGLGTTSSTATNPSVALDQLWLRFDIARTAYLTVGRQKVRWGVGRIWYPTDFLNAQPKDPFNPFDARLGVNMVKVHVPVESLGWNFYGYGLLDNNGPASTLGQLGGALRAELLLGPAKVWQAELGLGAVWGSGRRPRYAVDLSMPVGPFDVYGEAALRDGRDFTLFSFPDGVDTEHPLLTRVEANRGAGVMTQVTGGVSWTFNYTEKNMGILSAEYFFNQAGYGSAPEYVAQLLAPQFLGVTLDPAQTQTLYRAKQYLGVSLALPGLPELTWVTVSVSSVLNLSDPSGMTRVDAIFRVLTYLNVQVYGAAFYGTKFGQFSMSLDETIPAGVVGPQAVPVVVPAPKGQAGVLLRLAI